MKTRQYLTKDEAMAKEWYCRTELKRLFRLKPSPDQRPAGEVWQGKGLYSVYDKAQCLPMQPLRELTVSQRAALAAGRVFNGSQICTICAEYCNTVQQRKGRGMTPQQQASEWLLNCQILDSETTGLDGQAEIVEISILDQDGRVVLDTLVKPLKPIPAEATAIHGITNDMVATAPSWAAIHERVAEIVASKPLVIYNADYDLRLMAQTAAQYGLTPIEAEVGCAMLAYAEFYGDWNEYRGSYRRQRLTNAADQQGVVIDGKAHRALADVKMTLGVIKAMAASPVRDDVCYRCGTPWV